MKQTAVEWLFEQIVNRTDRIYFLKELEQAKAMEKSEKDKQYQRGFKDGSNHIKIIYNL
jgi:hypothetical protein